MLEFVRSVLVTTKGIPTISDIGANSPPGASLVAGVDSSGKLRALPVESGKVIANTLTAFNSYAVTVFAARPPPTPSPPETGGPWFPLGFSGLTESDGDSWLVFYWGSMS
jgi:hypothetical protein